MRVGAAVLLLATLAGCRSEPTFDTRYEEKAAMIRNSAETMEREAAGQIAAANAAERAIGNAAPGVSVR